MFVYRCIAEQLKMLEMDPCTTYGLAACRAAGEGSEVLAWVSDVSPDRRFVEELARQCTALQLDPVHLKDVVEDALA